jgi:hypothetical protein
MAELFQTTQQNISLHIQNIYEEGELTPSTTHKKSLWVRQEGNRQVERELDTAMIKIPKPLLEKQITNIKQIQTLEKLRDSLLPKLMSSEVRVEPLQ